MALLFLMSERQWNIARVIWQKAVNVDYYNPSVIEQIKALDKNKIYLIYCRTGHRSLEIAQLMDKMSFSQVYNLADGILS